MKPTARIEVHFTTKDEKEHVVVIKANGRVDAIMLRPAKPPRDPIPAQIISSDDLREVKIGDGPGVCYMIDGTLHCW